VTGPDEAEVSGGVRKLEFWVGFEGTDRRWEPGLSLGLPPGIPARPLAADTPTRKFPLLWGLGSVA
jgi:hypothetical protein